MVAAHQENPEQAEESLPLAGMWELACHGQGRVGPRAGNGVARHGPVVAGEAGADLWVLDKGQASVVQSEACLYLQTMGAGLAVVEDLGNGG